MANVRKITHKPRRDGSIKTSWRAAWVGPDGKRQSKNFAKKSEADAWLREIAAGRQGGSATMTMADLALDHLRWFEGLVRGGLREPSTRDGYATAHDVHLRADPKFAKLRLCDVTAPKVQTFLDDLFTRTGSTEVARRIRRTLVAWFRYGQRRGWMTGNPAQPCTVEQTSRPDQDEEVCEIPSKGELAALLRAAGEGEHAVRDTAVVRLLMFGGLRISELLGLSDDAAQITARGGMLKIRERLERRYAVLGRVKSEKARRDVPVGAAAALAVRSWRLARGPARAFAHIDLSGSPVRVPGRLLPAPDGADLWRYQHFLRQCWTPLMRRAGLLQMLPDARGKNRPVPAFSPHTLRHVAASLWIEQGLRPKKVQELLGHSTLQLTMDLYGHLWRDEDEDDALAQASEALISTTLRGKA